MEKVLFTDLQFGNNQDSYLLIKIYITGCFQDQTWYTL